ncbi:MAG TPA: hypothetical protein VGK59_23760 [Ohtaekwangia sp.]
MTLPELISDCTTKLTRAGSNRISGPDILQSVLNVIAFFATQIADIIPLWGAELTFQLDGSDDGKYCTYADTNGKKRIFETKVDDNTNHLPPADPLITENTWWREISASASAAIPEWAAGVYGPGLIIVFHNHSTDGRGLYVLLNPTRPYESANIEDEIDDEDWERLGGSSVGGGSWAPIAHDLSTGLPSGAAVDSVYKITVGAAVDLGDGDGVQMIPARSYLTLFSPGVWKMF